MEIDVLKYVIQCNPKEKRKNVIQKRKKKQFVIQIVKFFIYFISMINSTNNIQTYYFISQNKHKSD